MPIYLDSDDITLPHGESADENGIVAIGGNLSYERLYEAYSVGIFPWPHGDLPLLWFCPDPRFVLKPTGVKVSHSLRKVIKNTKLDIRTDQNFHQVMKMCQQSKRKGQDGTWITDDMLHGYLQLFRNGLAHSIEAYDDHMLVGGLYGVSIGSIFFGESMFFLEANASKICLLVLAAHLIEWDFKLIDCQSYTSHLEKLGAYNMKRARFLQLVKESLTTTNQMGAWRFHLSPQDALSVMEQTQTQRMP